MKHQTITSLPASPDDERRHRMREYALMQGIRFLCVVSFFWVRGWWLVVPVIGAIFLPYVAVVVANAVKSRAGTVQRPGGIVPVAATAGADAPGATTDGWADAPDDARASDGRADSADDHAPRSGAGGGAPQSGSTEGAPSASSAGGAADPEPDEAGNTARAQGSDTSAGVAPKDADDDGHTR